MTNLFKHRCLVGFVITLLCFGCASFSSVKREPSVTEKAALLRVTQQYLTHLLRADENALNSFVIWGDFLAHRGMALSKDEVLNQARTLAVRWPIADHPLFELDLVDLQVKGNTARVVLRRSQRPDLPTVSVDLIWMGRAWLVQHDSIFGTRGLIAQHKAESKAPELEPS